MGQYDVLDILEKYPNKEFTSIDIHKILVKNGVNVAKNRVHIALQRLTRSNFVIRSRYPTVNRIQYLYKYNKDAFTKSIFKKW